MARMISGKPWKLIVPCPDCSTDDETAFIEFVKGDIEYHSGSLGDTQDWYYYGAKCPECQTLIKIPAENIPDGIRQASQERSK